MYPIPTETAKQQESERERSDGTVLLKKADFAALFQIGESTFDRLRNQGTIGPRALRVGGSLRWYRAEVIEWLSRPTPAGKLLDSGSWPSVWADILKRRTK